MLQLLSIRGCVRAFPLRRTKHASAGESPRTCWLPAHSLTPSPIRGCFLPSLSFHFISFHVLSCSPSIQPKPNPIRNAYSSRHLVDPLGGLHSLHAITSHHITPPVLSSSPSPARAVVPALPSSPPENHIQTSHPHGIWDGFLFTSPEVSCTHRTAVWYVDLGTTKMGRATPSQAQDSRCKRDGEADGTIKTNRPSNRGGSVMWQNK